MWVQRYGSNLVLGILVVLTLLFLLLESWVLFGIFLALSLGSIFVRGVIRSTGR